MVVKVKLANGTTYDASEKFRELKAFLENLEVKSTMTNDEIEIQKQKVRRFISKLTADKEVSQGK